LIAGNDTVPISMAWPYGLYSTECLLLLDNYSHF